MYSFIFRRHMEHELPVFGTKVQVKAETENDARNKVLTLSPKPPEGEWALTIQSVEEI